MLFRSFTRDGIREIKNTQDQYVFSDVFPDTKIKKTDASVQKWSLEGQHFSYLGCGIGGGVTGKGATLRIIDDLIKDVEEALNEESLAKAWRWLSGTFTSRTDGDQGGDIKEIFCATLWAENDPQKILENTEGDDWYIISMPAHDEKTDKMLCDKILNKKNFIKIKNRMAVDSRTKVVFYANYMCEAIDDNETKVFARSSLKTYRDLPMQTLIENGIEKIVPAGWFFAFADTADEGTDNFAMPILMVVPSTGIGEPGSVYLVDSIFDQLNLTFQEIAVKHKIKEHNIKTRLVVESNNAGAYFIRNLRAKNKETDFYGQYSGNNKMVRIFNMANLIKNYFYFPEEPNPTTQKFMNQVYKLMITSKKNDDAPDSLAGAAYHLDSNFRVFG